MLMLPPSVKIYLATEPTDMRKGFDGLCALVKQSLGRDVFSGHLFVFVSRRRDRVKVLAWDRGGFVLYYKRLEKGRFQMPDVPEGQRTVILEGTQLSMLLSGFDPNLERLRRWKPRESAIDTGAKM